MDHHVPHAITNGLGSYAGWMCSRPTKMEQAGFENQNNWTARRSCNECYSPRSDLLTEATQRQRQTFSGVIYAHQLHMSIGNCVRDLEIIVQVGEPEDMTGQTLFLPL
jgi:hypothetical protein